jgi:hypothetical protein
MYLPDLAGLLAILSGYSLILPIFCHILPYVGLEFSVWVGFAKVCPILTWICPVKMVEMHMASIFQDSKMAAIRNFHKNSRFQEGTRFTGL